MLKDARGSDVTTDNPVAVAAIDRMVDHWLGYGQGATAIFEGIAADPRCVLAQTQGAVLNLFMESAAGRRAAQPYLAKARLHADKASRREQLYLFAVEAWAKGDADLAIRLHTEIAAQWPRDLGNVKLAQYHQFNRGDAAGMLALIEAVMAQNRDDPHAHGMRAFALEECHRLRDAEIAGRFAVELRRREPWAHHAVAHVMETEGRIDEGIDWLEAHAETWDDCNSFMLTHNWWHLALFHLDRDDTAHVLGLYDQRIWGVWKEYSQDQVNAVATLWRLEMRGVDVGARWHDVAHHIAGRESDHVEPFLDLHYLYALARAGLETQAARFLASLEDHAAQARRHCRRAWGDVALPLARGILDHARGRFEAAAEAIGPLLPRLAQIGGSHAQRDLFVQTFIDSGLRARRGTALSPLLADRARRRPTVAQHFRDLGRLARIEGAMARAADADHRAEALARSYAA
ncbi:tetratricopeptide repeat protein [Oleomonas cavernae]|uniref:Tetratricopeptide repeat protein 38 n=1 Tax=Oleomonas cavernae TaxID=2320859 RepID=A0A418WEQ3_9PROT|nr:tetratricopeptide repeat protein [Oleomonas cavernae]RJF88495.1 tetratricopeptide repeat protein [Oleomonas cavernae]